MEKYVKIIDFFSKDTWYSNKMGQIFKVTNKTIPNHYQIIGLENYISFDDCIEVTKEEYEAQQDTFKLPKNWHVVVNEENQEIVSKWYKKIRNILDPKWLLNITDICGKPYNDNYGHNRKGEIRGISYNFGQEISFYQFRKYVLKEDIYEKPIKEDLNCLVNIFKELNIS